MHVCFRWTNFDQNIIVATSGDRVDSNRVASKLNFPMETQDEKTSGVRESRVRLYRFQEK